MNSWGVTIREIIIVTIALIPVMTLGFITQAPPETVGAVAAVVALMVGLPLEMYVRGLIHWRLLKILLPMEHNEGD